MMVQLASRAVVVIAFLMFVFRVDSVDMRVLFEAAGFTALCLEVVETEQHFRLAETALRFPMPAPSEMPAAALLYSATPARHFRNEPRRVMGLAGEPATVWNLTSYAAALTRLLISPRSQFPLGVPAISIGPRAPMQHAAPLTHNLRRWALVLPPN